MDEQDNSNSRRQSTVSGGRVFTAVTPSEADIEKAKQFAVDACPRRYCWWWRSLSFDWETPITMGCTFPQAKKHPGRRLPDVACVRSDSESSVDQFESREPHMLEDGIDGTAWFLRSHEFNGTTPHPGWEDYYLPGWNAKQKDNEKEA